MEKDNPADRPFGRYFREICAQRRLSTGGVAARAQRAGLRLGKSTVDDMYKGKTKAPTDETLLVLQQVLRLNEDEFARLRKARDEGARARMSTNNGGLIAGQINSERVTGGESTTTHASTAEPPPASAVSRDPLSPRPDAQAVDPEPATATPAARGSEVSPVTAAASNRASQRGFMTVTRPSRRLLWSVGAGALLLSAGVMIQLGIAPGMPSPSSSGCLSTEGSCAATAEFERFGEKWTVCDVKGDGKGAILFMRFGDAPERNIVDWGKTYSDGECGTLNAAIREGTKVSWRLCLTDAGRVTRDPCTTGTDRA